ncbi:uncharacterized protein F4807DRAFT_449428 [Annulohypoxylon truncatum]|uniref:uncharacterized protein n=1 Tax=Annulohypoxylon truncatum TaxID=327061 RepID=UPI002008C984|nr:uncharacterized protein F4807DRAFT_449428 [Annulohypoxylon truncatum]KAI1215202.1 hypothetical protein F4807DRAFT_449428 [Annulohypoxylon truncatum]
MIGAVTMDEDMAYADDKLQLPWWLMPRIHPRRRLGGRIPQRLSGIVSRNVEAMKARADRDEPYRKSPSVLALSLQDIELLMLDIIKEIYDQLKTFLFAGHDTTTYPTLHALKAVRGKLDSLFGQGATRDPAIVREKLLSSGGGEIICSLFIMTLLYLEIQLKTSFLSAGWSCWRSFERGSRNCIRQELANIEACIILGMLAYRYEFIKVFLGEVDLDNDSLPTVNTNGQIKVKSELYSIMGKPVDGIVMKW